MALSRRSIMSRAPSLRACACRAHRAHRAAPPESCPARSARSPASPPATPKHNSADAVALNASLSTARNAAVSAEAAQPMAVTRAISGCPFSISDTLRAVGDAVDRAGQRHHGARVARIARERRVLRLAPRERRKLRAVEPHRVRVLRDQRLRIVRARRRAIDEHRVEHPGNAPFGRDLEAPPRSRRAAPRRTCRD